MSNYLEARRLAIKELKSELTESDNFEALVKLKKIMQREKQAQA